jgi:hypothetical protein
MNALGLRGGDGVGNSGDIGIVIGIGGTTFTRDGEPIFTRARFETHARFETRDMMLRRSAIIGAFGGRGDTRSGTCVINAAAPDALFSDSCDGSASARAAR